MVFRAFVFITLTTLSGAQAEEPIFPLPPAPQAAGPKFELGQALFHETKLSRDNTVSCATCHDLQKGGVDGLRVSKGIGGHSGAINAPTVFNSALNFRQFWNGRAKNLEEQVEGPIHNPDEMGSTWDDVVAKLKADERYRSLFKDAYGEAPSERRVKDAIAEFERSLVTPNSRFDRYLRGEKNVLTAQELRGYDKFKSYGCIACHQGVNVGGNMYQTMGVMGDYFKDRNTPITDADLGRFTVTGKPADRHVFRVPSLRNIELTAPYFHDGSAKTLPQAIDTMARYQLGLKLNKTDNDAIAAFLKSLTGERPATLGPVKAGAR